MNKKHIVPKKEKLIGSKIGVKLLACVFCSFGISLALFIGLYAISDRITDKYSSTVYVAGKLSDLQTYVERNGVKSENLSTLTAWFNKNDIQFMHIYRGNELIFNSDDPVDDSYAYDEREQEFYWDNRTISFIRKIEYVPRQRAADSVSGRFLPDGRELISGDQSAGADRFGEMVAAIREDTVRAFWIAAPRKSPAEPTDGRLEVRSDARFDVYITYEDLNVFLAVGTDSGMLILLLLISVLLSLFVFAFLILYLSQNRVKYISELASEVAQIEGGMIDKSVTVKGRDEIASLAQNVDDMRLSLVGRLQSEKEAYDANRELITAMSHDLRTPLSALIGYLEIVSEGVYSTEEQKNTYIRKSVEKAYQLKAMSDKLFDYFTVFKEEEATSIEPELYDGYGLLTQMISEQSYMLEEKGFEVIFEDLDDGQSFTLQADSSSLLRVFDNIYSNILKYGDPAQPVRIRLENDRHNVRVHISNGINRSALKIASTKIGLKSCRRLMARMNGTLKTDSNANTYTVTLILQKYTGEKT